MTNEEYKSKNNRCYRKWSSNSTRYSKRKSPSNIAYTPKGPNDVGQTK